MDKKIHELIAERDTLYHLTTLNILTLLKDKITGPIQKLLHIDKNVNWFSVERLINWPKFIAVIGNIQYAVGDEYVDSNGNNIVITDENIKTNTQTIRIVVSIDKIVNGTTNDVYNELKLLHTISLKLSDDEINNYLNDPDNFNTNKLSYVESLSPVVEKVKTEMIIDGFDCSTLSSTQIKTLTLTLSNKPENQRAN